jgi:hypothetical protein
MKRHDLFDAYADLYAPRFPTAARQDLGDDERFWAERARSPRNRYDGAAAAVVVALVAVLVAL